MYDIANCGPRNRFVANGKLVSNCNIQNLPRGGELRRSVLAPPGWAIVVCDSSQIEARVTAWLAGETWLVEAFREGRDIYSEFASEIYDRHVDRKRIWTDAKGRYLDKNKKVVASKDDAHRPDALEGFVGKVSILGLGYGMGAIKFDQTLKQGAMGPPVFLPESMPAMIVQLYRRRNPNIVALWRKMDYVIFCMATGVEGELGPITYGREYIRLPNGMFLHYPDLQGTYDDRGRLMDVSYATLRGRTRLYGALLVENVVQALARIVVADQMLEIYDCGYPIATMSHDEVVALAKKQHAERCFKQMLEIMHTPPAWAPDLPIAAEGGWAENYSK